ncbi:hypothetical protein LP419_35730 [Massilia sp. H-1]|nr:hypothetical protein LP419_35730 [Massilia sp. H-1]
MQQDQRGPLALFDIVQAHAVHVDKGAVRRMQALGLALLRLYVEQRGDQVSSAQQGCGLHATRGTG